MFVLLLSCFIIPLAFHGFGLLDKYENKSSKKDVCKHYWHKIGEFKEWDYDEWGTWSEDKVQLFCEKCECEVSVRPARWSQIDERQKIISYKYDN